MPITFESASTSAPPELPGEIAASVWMRSTSACDSWALPGMVRWRPETMPTVTVFSKPSGLPRATASWPTWGRLVSNVAAGQTGLVDLEHRDIGSGSVPTSVAGSCSPDAKATVYCVPLATTWLLVTM